MASPCHIFEVYQKVTLWYLTCKLDLQVYFRSHFGYTPLASKPPSSFYEHILRSSTAPWFWWIYFPPAPGSFLFHCIDSAGTPCQDFKWFILWHGTCSITALHYLLENFLFQQLFPQNISTNSSFFNSFSPKWENRCCTLVLLLSNGQTKIN